MTEKQPDNETTGTPGQKMTASSLPPAPSLKEVEECANPACKPMVELLQRTFGGASKKTQVNVNVVDANPKQAQTSKKTVGVQVTTSNDMIGGGGGDDEHEEEAGRLADWRRDNCPLDKDALGRGTWGLLHTTAAYYPDQPTAEQKVEAINFIKALADFYPCSYCARDFRRCIKKDPPRVDSRKDLSIWLCEQHNLVNKKLGKPKFKCDLDLLDQRWKQGHKKCWEDPDPKDS